MNTFDLSRNFFDFCFENPEKISPNHIAIYFFAVEHCNRLGWKEKFGFPTQMACEAIGIKKPQTYIKYFNDLVEWEFFNLIEKSRNQYSSNIISLLCAMPKNGKALGKANRKHGECHAKKRLSMGQSNSPINKPINLEHKKEDKETRDDFSFSDKEYRQKSAKAFVECVKVYPKAVRQEKINFAKNSWIEAVERADGFEPIVMAVNMFVDYVGTTKQELKFVKQFQDWLDQDQFKIDWTAEKLKLANIPAQHIHQDFIDIWTLKAEPTKAKIEAARNLLSKMNHLKTDDLIRVFKKDIKIDLEALTSKLSKPRGDVQKLKLTPSESLKCAQELEPTVEELIAIRKKWGKERFEKMYSGYLHLLEEADNTT